MSAITTHILDTSRGRPADGVHVTLEVEDGSAWTPLGTGLTDVDGRLRTLLDDGVRPRAAIHRLRLVTLDLAERLLGAHLLVARGPRHAPGGLHQGHAVGSGDGGEERAIAHDGLQHLDRSPELVLREGLGGRKLGARSVHGARFIANGARHARAFVQPPREMPSRGGAAILSVSPGRR